MMNNEPHRPNKPNIDDLLPSDLLSDDETVVFAIKPSLWTIAFLSFRTVLIAGIMAAVAAFLGPRLKLSAWAGYIITLSGAAILARMGFAFLQWISRSYVLTDRRVIRIRGVFTIDIFQSSLPKIQNTFLVLPLVQRVLGLGNIVFTTAGTGGVEAIWRHVKDPLSVHQKLIRAINAASNKSLPTQEQNGLS